MSPTDSGRGGVVGARWRRTDPWLRWVYLGFGVVCFVGFFKAARQVRTLRFERAAKISGVLCAVGFACAVIWAALTDTTQNASPEQDPAQPIPTAPTTTYDWGAVDILFGITMAIWLGLGVYGYWLNREYEQLVPATEDRNPADFRAPRSGTGSAYPPFGAPPPHPPFGAKPAAYPGAASTPPADVLRAEADRVLAIQPLGNEPASTPPNTPDS